MSSGPEKPNPFEQALRYWTLVRSHGRWVFLITLTITLVSFNVIAMLQDYYEATTTILVDPQQIPDRYVTSTVVEDPAHRLSTISQQVLSATRLQQIIDQYNLYPHLRNKVPSEQIIAMIVKDIDLKVKEGGSSLSSFTITYKGTDAKLVSEVTNQLASGFIEWNLKNREQVVAGTTDFLKSELEKARQDLKDQESKLSEFKIAHAGELPDDQPGNLQMMAQLQSALQANREALNRLDIQRTVLLHSGETGTPTAGASASPISERAQLLSEKRDLEHKLDELRKTYTAEFPDIVTLNRRLDEVNGRLRQLPPEKPEEVASSGENVQLSLLDKQIARLNEEQRQIKSQMNSYRVRMEAAPIRQQQMLDLTRNYQVSSNDYASLLEKTSASQLAAELEKRQKGERFTILDPARTPGRPFKPNRPLLMIAAALGAFCFSIVTVAAKDMLSGTLRTEHDVAEALPRGVPLLAIVPMIQTAEALRRRRLTSVVIAVVVLVVCGAETLFLLKIRPIL